MANYFDILYIQNILKLVLLCVCLSVIPVTFVKSLGPEEAQVSWRCAGRRTSVRLYGVFLKSETEQRQANFNST